MAQHPHYQVKVTGHSLGAALALLNGMSLKKAGIESTMINFGQPRVFDDVGADFTMARFSHYRVTHWQDPVPNMPTMAVFGYHHTAFEMFENDKKGTVTQCNSSGEDPNCTDRWLAFQYNVDDHLVYLGMCLGTSCGTCPNLMTTNPMASSAVEPTALE